MAKETHASDRGSESGGSLGWLLHVAGADAVRRTLNRGLAVCILAVIGVSAIASVYYPLSGRIELGIISASLLPFYALAWGLNRRGEVAGAYLLATSLAVASALALVMQGGAAIQMGPPANLVLPIAVAALFVGPRAGVVFYAIDLALIAGVLVFTGLPPGEVAAWLPRLALTFGAVTAILTVGSAMLRRALRTSAEANAQLTRTNTLLEREICDRRKAEQSARDTTVSLQEAQRLGKIGSWDYDPLTQEISWSQELYALLERDPRKCAPTVAEGWAYYSPEEAARIDEALRAVIATGERRELDIQPTLPSGRAKHLHLVLAARNVEDRVLLRGIVQDVTERRLDEDKIRASQQQLRAFAARLDAARDEEGRRISRELHDVLGQQLTAAGMELTRIEEEAGDGNAELLERCNRLRALLEGTVEIVQKISSELRFGHVDLLGFPAAISWQLKEFEKTTRIRTSLTESGSVPRLPEDRAVALFRVLQEALTNVARHAGATRVEVLLHGGLNGVKFEIRDNGRGISLEQRQDQRSLGLLGMHERAQAVGGEVFIDGKPGKGTVVVVSLPWSSLLPS
jgi:signal transduction histidine kinase